MPTFPPVPAEPAKPRARFSTEILALAFGMSIQGLGGIWWAATINSRVEHLEKTTAPLESGLLARIDERTAASARRQDRMSDLLQTLVLSKSNSPQATVIERPSSPSASADPMGGVDIDR